MKKDTVCRLCSSCCPIEVTLEGGRLVSAKRKSLLPEAKQLICPKLNAAPEIVYAAHRLKTPLIKDKTTGRFIEAGWDEALGLVAEKFMHHRDVSGAGSVGWLRGMAADWGTPWDYANRLMNAFGSPNTIGNGSVCHVAREMAHVITYGAMTLPEAGKAGCILVWGKNDRDTSPGAAEAILSAKQKGATLIVVDPVKTTLAAMADIWLQVKPGHDGLLAMAMACEIISKELYDRDFIGQYTVGFDALKSVALQYPADRIANDIWLDPGLVKEAARIYATTKPACIIDGNGLDMQRDVFQMTRAVCILRGLTGNLDTSGGDGIPQPVGLKNIQMKDRLPKEAVPITCDYNLFNQFSPTWGNHVQSCVADAVLDERPYPLKMLVVQSGNPAVTMADSNRVVKALEHLDFLVVLDLFMTRTARLADVILPACSCFEKSQLNRAFMRNNPLILQQQVMEPLGDSWPDWKIVFELGRRLGLEAEFPWQTVEEAIDHQLEPVGVTVEMLKSEPSGLRVEAQAYEKYKTRGFATPSGKLEFYSKILADNGHSPIPYQDGPPEDSISFTDQKERYPFIGMSGARTNRFTHSQFHNIPSLMKNQPGCHVDIHPEDAGANAISPGDQVKVDTPRGSVQMPARITKVVHPGSVRIGWGWGEVSSSLNLNNLTDDDGRNPVTGTPSSRSFMCSITRVDG